MRKFITPILFLVFLIFVHWWENTYLGELFLSGVTDARSVNKINRIVFITVPIVIVVLDILPNASKMKTKLEKVFYIVMTSVWFFLLTLLFIILLQWK
ncbi:MAG: hypothetical protein JXR62_05830 [Bacilli bacterium]|nr:hypothetical protein [Bacilli bacterium]